MDDSHQFMSLKVDDSDQSMSLKVDDSGQAVSARVTAVKAVSGKDEEHHVTIVDLSLLEKVIHKSMSLKYLLPDRM